mmetsp:Transcript_37532/g.52100  ORF Transcript_37532/g.52100 Transcript_37532/m.52100 type:complete len:203 (+) Transcript_37532:287-895(+)
MKEFGNFLKISFSQPPRGHGRRSDTHAARCQGRGISKDRILIESDVAQLAHFLHLVARDCQRAQIPKHQMVVSPASHHLVSFTHQVCCQCHHIGLHLLRVNLERRIKSLLECDRQSCNLVVVRASLQRGKDSVVDASLIIIARALCNAGSCWLWTTSEEDHARPWPTQRLVCGGSHNITKLKGVGGFTRCHQARDVCHVTHQ